ncbi:MAG: YbfB/YjiJ family MFS transporter [Methylobacteriaceae bacterium]|nr:YbfB/YjiJ family MFS transporter [Methylobacteriaceae bacterium]
MTTGRRETTDGALPAVLAGLLAMAAGMGVGRFVYTPILPAMMREAGLSAADAGFVASANFLGYLVGALAAAALARQAARPTALFLALAASAATSAAMALGETRAVFAALRFASGLASAFVFYAATTLSLEALMRRGRLDLQTVHFSGVGLGVAASALFTAAVFATGGDWRMAWLASGAITALALVAVVALAPRDASEAIAAPPAPAASRSVAPIVLAYALVGYGYVITATFLVAIMRETAGPREETLAWLVVGLSAALSLSPWSALARRVGAGRAFALACLAEAAGVAASVLAPGLAGALVAAALLGGTFMALTALGLAVARRAVGGDGRRIVATMTAAFGAGQVIGPAVAGLMREATGDYVLASLTAAAGLVVAAALALAGERG